MMSDLEQKPLKLGFFRGADFTTSVGVTDWRIGLFMPEFGFETWIFGSGDKIPLSKTKVNLAQVNAVRLPYMGTLQLMWLYAKQAKKLELDVVICNPGFALAGRLCKRLCPQTKIVLDVRSIPVETQGIGGLIHKYYFNYALRAKFFDGISVITSGMRDDLDKQYHFKGKMPTTVWGSGFDHQIFRPSLNGESLRQSLNLQNKFILMFHGSLSPTRGLDQSIRALGLLLERGMDDIRLLFIGGGSAKSELSRLAASVGVENQVIFLPPVPHHEIPELIAAADMGIDPLPDHPWWRHQSALKVYEYLAMGKPVLATKIPCHDGISKAVILVPDNAPSTLAEGVRQFRSLSRAEKSDLREIALQDAQQHTWKARAEILANFIKKEVLER